MRRKPTGIVILAALCALVLAAAGCGGSSKSSSSTTTAATTEAASTEAASTEAASTEAASTEAASTEAASTEAATTTAAATNSGTPKAAFTSAQCQQLVSASQDAAKALSGSGGTDIHQVDAAMQKLASGAPSAIKPDLQTLAALYHKVALIGLKAGATPSADQMQKLQQLSQTINSAKLTAASQHISTWVQQNCTK